MSKTIQKAILDFVDNRMEELAEEIYEAEIIEAMNILENQMVHSPVYDLVVQAIKDIDISELSDSRELKQSLDDLYSTIGIR